MIEKSQASGREAEALKPPSSRQGKKILIVDDDPVARESLEEFLQESSFSVRSIGSAPEALRLLGQDDFDLVITDLVMPDMDGISMTKAIRELRKDVPVLVMTGFASIEYAVEAIKAGATDFITKPLKLDHVVFIINRVLETRSLEKAGPGNGILQGALQPRRIDQDQQLPSFQLRPADGDRTPDTVSPAVDAADHRYR